MTVDTVDHYSVGITLFRQWRYHILVMAFTVSSFWMNSVNSNQSRNVILPKLRLRSLIDFLQTNNHSCPVSRYEQLKLCCVLNIFIILTFLLAFWRFVIISSESESRYNTSWYRIEQNIGYILLLFVIPGWNLTLCKFILWFIHLSIDYWLGSIFID